MIGKLRRFLRLAPADRTRVAKAALVVEAIRVGLWLLPFRALSRLVAKTIHAPNGSRGPDQATLDRVVWSVRTTSQHLPWTITCLTRAMAAQVLLGQLGEPTQLRLGVAKDEQGQLQAHAWLEKDGNIVIGGEGDMSNLTRMPPLEIWTQ